MGETILLVQVDRGGPRAAILEGEGIAPIEPGIAVLDLARRALRENATLAEAAGAMRRGPREALPERFLPPVTHPEPARLHATGTGLTHLGSASARDAMHQAPQAAETDSMRMFRMGVEGGRPEGEAVGVQPEWFWKGNGLTVAGSGHDLVSPAFALDAGEEPEIAGIYLVGEDGAPHRLGFALANEFSDHVTERGNYLWLAHSKIRPFGLGPALRTGELPADVRGTSRILRDGRELWAAPFLTGEANMSHSLANLEHHHFKHGLHRRPGDLHVHMFGTATLSVAAGVSTRDGDLFEIAAEGFGPPLRNRLRVEGPQPTRRVAARAL